MEFVYLSVVVIIFNAIMSVYRLAFGIKSNALYCGIYGVSMKPDANIEAVMAKIKLLGTYNIPRGRDACGLFIDGQLYKGTGTRKLFSDFIEETDIPTPKDNLVVIGHNRASTRGANTEANTHPFLINDRLVGVHNGTISNEEVWAKKYELDSKKFEVDSQLLYTLLDQFGPEVLNHYHGFAALAYTYPADPNVLYLYHGASKNYKLADKPAEERPLVYVETKDGLFFSSLVESLMAIRDDTSQLVYNLPCNLITQIENGEFTDVEVKVDREEANVYVAPVVTGKKYVGVGGVSKSTSIIGRDITPVNLNNTSTISKPTLLIENPSVYKEPLILKETLPMKATNNILYKEEIIYIHHGRYWVYPRKIANGIFHLKKGGVIVNSFLYSDKTIETCFFYNGIMLKDKDAYNVLKTLEADKGSFLHRSVEINYAAIISKYAAHPVTAFSSEGRNVDFTHRYGFYSEMNRVKGGSFTPRFSGRNYVLENSGFLESIKGSHGERTLHPEFTDSSLEMTKFLAQIYVKPSSPIIDAETSIPGGNVAEASFHESESNRYDQYDAEAFAIETTNEGNIKYFYEIVFKDMDDAHDCIGDIETQALRNYVKKYKSKLLPLDMDEKEVDLTVMDLILTAEKSGMAIIDLCDGEDDKFSLMSAYDEIISKLTPTDAEEDEEPEEKDSCCSAPLSYASKMDDVLDHLNNAQNDMTVDATADDMLENIESLGNIAKELESEEGDEFAEEVAFVIKRDVTNLLKNLRTASTSFNKVQFGSKVEKLLDNKISILG